METRLSQSPILLRDCCKVSSFSPGPQQHLSLRLFDGCCLSGLQQLCSLASNISENRCRLGATSTFSLSEAQLGTVAGAWEVATVALSQVNPDKAVIQFVGNNCTTNLKGVQCCLGLSLTAKHPFRFWHVRSLEKFSWLQENWPFRQLLFVS